MSLILFTVLYISAHLGYYFIKGRYTQFFQTERGIFLYHFISFTSISFLGVLVSIKTTVNLFNTECAILGLHGIYSLSFLELWSLSQGGFSVSVLQATPINIKQGSKEIQELANIGDVKFDSRLQGIKKLGLLVETDGKLTLTKKGTLAFNFFSFISKITNIKDLG